MASSAGIEKPATSIDLEELREQQRIQRMQADTLLEIDESQNDFYNDSQIDVDASSSHGLYTQIEQMEQIELTEQIDESRSLDDPPMVISDDDAEHDDWEYNLDRISFGPVEAARLRDRRQVYTGR